MKSFSRKLLNKIKTMKKLTILLIFSWILLITQILAITSLYNNGIQDIPSSPAVVTLVDKVTSLKIDEKLEETLKNVTKNLTKKKSTTQILDTVTGSPARHSNANSGENIQTAHEPTAGEKIENIEQQPILTQSQQQNLLQEKINDSGGEVKGDDGSEIEITSEQLFEIPTATTTSHEDLLENKTEKIDVNLTEEHPMPVFSEWAQKQMAEAEKLEEESVNASTMKKNSKPGTGHKIQAPLKLRAKNYAGPDCGAKILAANPEAQSTSSVLSSHRDEYLLNPCTSRIWFVVELCEPIQAEKIELANFELFSSSPKDFSIGISNRFPTRDWSNVGQFTAKDERDVQDFKLSPHLFGKFIRVDIHSHYNSEHYCPVSLFRVYGTSEFEAFETANQPAHDPDDDDEEDELKANNSALLDDTSDGKKKKDNILKSAGEAVLNIVKKAAEVLVKTNDNQKSINQTTNSIVRSNELETAGSNRKDFCITFPYKSICMDCTEMERINLEKILNCNFNTLTSLLNNLNFLDDEKSHLCAKILGFPVNVVNIKTTKSVSELNSNQRNFLLNILPKYYLAALCNIIATNENKLALNENLFINESINESVLSSQLQQNEILSAEKTADKIENVENLTTDQYASGRSISHQDEHGGGNLPDEKNTDENIKTQIPSPPITTSTATEDSENIEENKSENNLENNNDINIYNVPIHADTKSTIEMEEIKSNEQLQKPSLSTDINNAEREENSSQSWENLENIEHQDLLDSNLGTNGGHQAHTISHSTVTQATPTMNSGNIAQKGQPESVFLRLSNRIKALERNMSLSSQYLEELSRRYKKQVEELQHSFAKTLNSIEEQNRRSIERETELKIENRKLRQDLNDFITTITDWKNILIVIGGFLTIQFVILVVIMQFCFRNKFIHRNSLDREMIAVVQQRKKVNEINSLRRKSIEGLIGHVSPSLRKKRPSEEALNISGTYEDLLIIDKEEEKMQHVLRVERSTGKKHKHKHRKISQPNLSSSNETSARNVNKKPQLTRTESAPEQYEFNLNDNGKENRIEELPLVLEDNDEFIIPTSDLAYNEFIPDSTSERLNGGNPTLSSNSSIDSKSSKVSKTNIARRLSSPAFFKSTILRASMGKKKHATHSVAATNTNSQSAATTPTNHNNSLPEETPKNWYKLKNSSSQINSNFNNKKKAKSESPESYSKSTNNGLIPQKLSNSDTILDLEDHKSTVSIVNSDLNNSNNSSINNSEKKTGGSFRKLFKKVF
uniref:Putative conserved plasma membrane protein n=1 Tax=Corethrella appendiculata TaxID=1370023 RepID=U5ET81_9DIPT